MKKLFSALTIFLLAACGVVENSEILEFPEISKLEYKHALGAAVCQAVNDLNSQGVLDDEQAWATQFDPLLQTYVKEMEYTEREWLEAKAKYFPDEEDHTKLIKMHITWCLLGDSFEE